MAIKAECDQKPIFAIQERRRLDRKNTRNLCELVAANGKPIGSCLVRNLSDGGALIEISMDRIPSQFMLVDPSHRVKVASKVVWREQNLVGVEFITKPRFIQVSPSKLP